MPEIVVAFDLDDTLYREWDYVASGYRAVALELAKATGADAVELQRIIAEARPLGFEAALKKLEGREGIKNFSIDSMIEIYRAHKPDIQLRPGAAELLEILGQRGIHTVLITDGSTRHQRAKIKALGLEKYFKPDDILISEETGGDKTTERPWELVETTYSAPGTRYFYVGDNMSKDFHLPQQRGWTGIMLLSPEGSNVFRQHPTEFSAEKRPLTTIVSLTDILKHQQLNP